MYLKISHTVAEVQVRVLLLRQGLMSHLVKSTSRV
jgi:hypothetical protein